jgi:hypothetical protein
MIPRVLWLRSLRHRFSLATDHLPLITEPNALHPLFNAIFTNGKRYKARKRPQFRVEEKQNVHRPADNVDSRFPFVTRE